MFKFTEQIGELTLSFEADTIEGVINLKNEINPSVLVAKSGRKIPTEGVIGDRYDWKEYKIRAEGGATV